LISSKPETGWKHKTKEKKTYIKNNNKCNNNRKRKRRGNIILFYFEEGGCHNTHLKMMMI